MAGTNLPGPAGGAAAGTSVSPGHAGISHAGGSIMGRSKSAPPAFQPHHLGLGVPHFMPQRPSSAQASDAAHLVTTSWNATSCYNQIPPPCGPLVYGNGPVMHNPSIVNIFWKPAGYSYDTGDVQSVSPGDAMYEQAQNGFFLNASNSGWMDIAQQYTDGTGAPGKTVSLVSAIQDNDPFPCGSSCNSISSPLSDWTLVNEVYNLSKAHGTPTGTNSEYFVYLPLNVIECTSVPATPGNCSGNAPNPYAAYCAYHSSFWAGPTKWLYAAMSDDGGMPGCIATPYADSTFPYGPVGDEYGSWEVSTLSHEFMESITDPVNITGWTGYVKGVPQGNEEIGDLCSWVFPNAPGYDDHANILMGPRPFFIQPEFSNSVYNSYPNTPCVLPLEPGNAVPSIPDVNYASTVSSGGTQYIFLNATDGGTTAGWGNVSVEFPGNPAVGTISVVKSTFPAAPSIIPAGTPLSGCYSTCTNTTTYPIVEAHANSWVTGTKYSLEISFAPPSSGTYKFYVKSVSAVVGSAFATDWIPHNAATTDQLGENVTAYSFTVSSGGGGPSVTSFAASPNPVVVNTATTLSVTTSGGTTPYTYSYAGLPTGCTSSNTATLSCTPTMAGSSTVTVTVTDANSKTATGTLTLVVNAANVPTITGFSASPNPVPVNTATSISVTVSGGTTPYTYSYAGLPTGCTSSNTATLSCTPTAAGSSTVTVTVTDANSKTATGSLTLVVNSAAVPTITAFAASPNPVTVNAATTLTVTVSGGTTPYTYAYTGLPAGCSTSNTATLSCTPTAAGNFTITVTVTDAGSKTAAKSMNLTVSSSGGFSVTTFTASVNPVTVNQATTLSVTAAGGSTPYSYSYAGLPAGCTSSSTASLGCTPTVTGSFPITVTVTDATGKTATKTLTLTVSAANSGGGGGGQGSTILGLDYTTFLVLVALIAVVAIGVAALLIMSRRGRAPPQVQPAGSASYGQGPAAAQPGPQGYAPTPAPAPQAPAPPQAAQAAFCSKCGSQVEADFAFCRSCGAQVTKSTTTR